MTNELQNTMIRELTSNELLAVSGGKQVCAYEVANRCYNWVDQGFWDMVIEIVNSYR